MFALCSPSCECRLFSETFRLKLGESIWRSLLAWFERGSQVAKISTATFKGISGETYGFNVYPMGQAFKAVGAVRGYAALQELKRRLQP